MRFCRSSCGWEVESTGGNAFTLCVGYLTPSGIDTWKIYKWLLYSLQKDTGEIGWTKLPTFRDSGLVDSNSGPLETPMKSNIRGFDLHCVVLFNILRVSAI